jgi:hypothetical protein
VKLSFGPLVNAARPAFKSPTGKLTSRRLNQFHEAFFGRLTGQTNASALSQIPFMVPTSVLTVRAKCRSVLRASLIFLLRITKRRHRRLQVARVNPGSARITPEAGWVHLEDCLFAPAG